MVLNSELQTIVTVIVGSKNSQAFSVHKELLYYLLLAILRRRI
jgi:hypothetical protein